MDEFLKKLSGEVDSREKHRKKVVEVINAFLHDESNGKLKNIIEILWSSQTFTSKEYLVEKILANNSVKSIANKFDKTINNIKSDRSPELVKARYDKDPIGQIGTAGFTEIAWSFRPKKFAVLNKKPVETLTSMHYALPKNVVRYRKATGKEYGKYLDTLQRFKKDYRIGKIEEKLQQILDYKPPLYTLIDAILTSISENKLSEKDLEKFKGTRKEAKVKPLIKGHLLDFIIGTNTSSGFPTIKNLDRASSDIFDAIGDETDEDMLRRIILGVLADYVDRVNSKPLRSLATGIAEDIANIRAKRSIFRGER